MIVATKSVDGPLKGIVSKSSLMISRIESIAQAIQIDPKISSPAKEMFVISNEDVRNPKVRSEMSQALLNKHINSVVMFINKSGKPIPGMEESMFASYLNKPSQKDINAEFVRLVAELEEKNAFVPQVGQGDVTEAYVPEPPTTKAKEPDLGGLVIEEPTVFQLPIVEEAPEFDGDRDPALLGRIRNSENWAMLTTIAQEVNAASVVREVNESNAIYRATENYVTSLSENVTAIMSNPEYDTITKLNKVRAILHTKASLKAKTNSILEQSVEAIVMAIVDKAKQEVQSVTDAMDEKIMRAFSKRELAESPNVRLATIIERRAKTLVELNTMDLELKTLSTILTNTVNDTVSSVIGDSSSSIGAPILDSQLKARFGTIVPENLLTVLDNLFKTGADTSKEMGQASEKIHSTIRKLYQLLSLYQEEQEVLAETIKYLKASRVEDTVIANTIMKKCMRLYVTSGDFEGDAISYLISRNKSYKNDNVLVVDASNSKIWSMFGIKTNSLSDMDNTSLFGKFNVVSLAKDIEFSGEVTDEMCQRLMSTLVNLAKHYSVINIITNTKDSVINKYFAPEVLAINYVVNCLPYDIEEMKLAIEATTVDNTAGRVILTNYISDSAAICTELGLINKYNMQLVTCNSIPEIRHCALNKQDPYDVESIVNDCKEVFSAC